MVQCQISRNLVNNSYLNKRNNEFNSKVNNFNNIDDINKAKKIMIELIERNKKDIETINSLQTNIDETDIKDINEELKKYKKSVENTNNFILSNKKRLSETKKNYKDIEFQYTIYLSIVVVLFLVPLIFLLFV